MPDEIMQNYEDPNDQTHIDIALQEIINHCLDMLDDNDDEKVYKAVRPILDIIQQHVEINIPELEEIDKNH